MSFRSPFSQHLDTNHVPSSGEAASIKAFLLEERENLRIIDATLELLSQALRRLSENRALRREFIDRHQALLSPVRALPTDILHQLLLAMIPTVPEWGAYSDGKVKVHPVVNISHVCGHWRDVALSMPSLWTHIPIDPLPSYTSLVFAPRGRNAAARYEQSMARLTDLATTFTARAGDRPISFSLTGEDPTGHANPELAKVVDPLIDVLRKAQWANVSLDLYFFAPESTYARLLPVPPRTQDALRTLKVHFTGPGATMRQYTILNPVDGSPRYLNLLDLNIPGQQLCDLRLNWRVLTSLSIGPVPGQHRWSGDGPMGVATLTTQQALVIMQRCPSLVQCEVRLYSGPAAASLPIASDPFLDAFTLPHLGTLKLLGRQAPKAFALSLMMPSLRHLSAIYDSGESMAPGNEESSGFVELVRRYGPQLLNVTFDYDSLTSSALKFCLSRLTNVTSLTMLPYLFEPRDSLSPTADSHTYSFDPDHDLLKALTPALNNGGADPLGAPFCFCPKLESVRVSLGYGEGYEHAQYWMDFVSGRRKGSLDQRTTSSPTSYIRKVFLTFHPLHKIEWDWRVDELREQGISAVGLVLDGNSYVD